MVDRRVLPGLVAGLIGLTFGVAAAVLNVPALALAAAASALAAGAVSVVHVRRLAEAEREASAGAALAHLLDLPQRARDEATSLVDHETGLPDARFFELAVEGRVAAARRHLWPVTVVLLELALRAEWEQGRPRSDALARFAAVVRRTVREADVVCRLAETSFAVILEDTSEEGGVWAAERLQSALARELPAVSRLAAGVASYPLHGLETDDVMVRAQAALTRACVGERGHGLGSVEVAQTDLA